MIPSAGLLDFFTLEASDYVERLDGLVAVSGPAGPEVEAFTRHARALRVSASASGPRDPAAASRASSRSTYSPASTTKKSNSPPGALMLAPRVSTARS